MKNLMRIILLGSLCLAMSGCEDPQVYGSVGFSSYGGGGYYGPGMRSSIGIGGRIY